MSKYWKNIWRHWFWANQPLYDSIHFEIKFLTIAWQEGTLTLANIWPAQYLDMKHPHIISVRTFEFVHTMTTIVTPSFGTYIGLKWADHTVYNVFGEIACWSYNVEVDGRVSYCSFQWASGISKYLLQSDPREGLFGKNIRNMGNFEVGR